MKTLKELKNNCTLIAEFKNPAFICKNSEQSNPYYGSTKCMLYCDNKGKYYIYKYIGKGKIEEYDNYEIAIKWYMEFIDIMLQR